MEEDREVLYAADIARIRGCSVRTARAWLAALEHDDGGKTVGRVGEKLYITRSALERVLPGAAPGSGFVGESRFQELWRQVQAIARAVHELREQVNDHDAGLQSARMRLFEITLPAHHAKT